VNEQIETTAAVIYRRLWLYVAPHKLIGLIAVAGMAASALIEASLVYLLRPLMDEALVAKNLEATRWLPVAFVFIFAARGITGFATEASLGWIGRTVISSLRRDVFRKFLTLPTRFFEERSTGPLLSRMTYNVEMVAESVTNVVTIAIRDVLTLIAAIGVMLLQSPKLAGFVAILIPILAVLVRVLGVAFRRYSSRIQDSVGEVTQVTEEIVTGNRIVKIFGGYDYEKERLDEVDERNRKQNLKLIRVRAMGVAVTQTVFGIGVAGVIYMAGLESLADNMTAGQFISFLGAMLWMLQPVRRITNVNATLQRGVAAAGSLFEIIDEPDEIDTGSKTVRQAKGSVEFRNVCFSYNEKTDAILDDISVAVEPGRSLAGTPIRDYTLNSLRDNISLVSQDVVLFNDSIMNNLAYGELKQHSHEELLRAAEAAHVLEFANELPDGLNTMVGDRGVLLSGGQRQRIAIGRALLKNAPVLILDEATSSLDTKSERRIQQALDELMKNRTTLVIAHRLSTVERADHIIVLDRGRIVESGTHKELLDRAGQYATLYRMQFSEE